MDKEAEQNIAQEVSEDDGGEKHNESKNDVHTENYVKHAVQPTDTLVGVCLKYKLTKQELQRFGAGSLTLLAPEVHLIGRAQSARWTTPRHNAFVGENIQHCKVLRIPVKILKERDVVLNQDMKQPVATDQPSTADKKPMAQVIIDQPNTTDRRYKGQVVVAQPISTNETVQTNQGKPNNHIELALCACCCCNCILGFVAIYYADQVDRLYESGKVEEAVSASKKAEAFSYASILSGGIFIAVIMIAGSA
eukprot:CAMPEP_0117748314 /NCGR_PEP_ID=MMETSP0947-20121206/9022_1 /TAXON_ID=44440 /ORGANISM="Chattonella subsalsa, Strain CCMP2191" /LENGTH=249 /DNA_ID=CAMNT_0005565913 /DNA_START=547 /DNA_END=1296 /DNA_ORIENTATION=+